MYVLSITACLWSLRTNETNRADSHWCTTTQTHTQVNNKTSFSLHFSCPASHLSSPADLFYSPNLCCDASLGSLNGRRCSCFIDRGLKVDKSDFKHPLDFIRICCYCSYVEMLNVEMVLVKNMSGSYLTPKEKEKTKCLKNDAWFKDHMCLLNYEI